MDNERASWIRCFGIPCHAWNTDLFQFLAKMVGSFICVNENTMKNECIDVAILLVKMSCVIVINETLCVCINGKSFGIKMMEDSRTPMCISVKSMGNRKENSFHPSKSDSSWAEDVSLRGEDWWTKKVACESK